MPLFFTDFPRGWHRGGSFLLAGNGLQVRLAEHASQLKLSIQPAIMKAFVSIMHSNITIAHKKTCGSCYSHLKS
jgi:hypothetical protein